MNKEEFNKYCAEVMGYHKDNSEYEAWSASLRRPYNPYDDLNQMAEVLDKLTDSTHRWDGMWESLYDHLNCSKGIKQAMRDFIESTKGE